MLRKLSTEETEEGEDDSPYMKFYTTFGRSIKMGIIEDSANRHKLAKLLRFKTSKSEGNFKSLDEYVEGMPEWQKTIYYVAGEVISGDGIIYILLHWVSMIYLFLRLYTLHGSVNYYVNIQYANIA